MRERRRGGGDLHDARVRRDRPAAPPSLARALELGVVHAMEKRLGFVGEVYRQGEAGKYAKLSKGLVAAGAGLLALGGRRSRAAAVAGGALVLAGELALRWSVFKAGFQSARDPKYTVVPQKARKAQREARAERFGRTTSRVQSTESRSTTKTSGSCGLITPPAPRAPYAIADGIVSLRRPPTFMPCTPWSQPGITCPLPSLNWNGCPRFHDASNSSPVVNEHADVVHGHLRPARRLVAVAGDDVLDPELERDVAGRLLDLRALRQRANVLPHPSILASSRSSPSRVTR